MPKNKGRGGKNYRKGKNQVETKRELIFKEDDECQYAQVLKILGNGIVEVNCFDGKKRQAIIRGTLKKKVWIQFQDVVLVGLRDYQDDKCDILHKYLADEVKELIALGEIPDTIQVNNTEDTKEIEWIKSSDEEENQQDNPLPQKKKELPKSDDEEEEVNLDDL